MNLGVRIIDTIFGAFRSVEGEWCQWLKALLAPLLLAVACQLIPTYADIAEGPERHVFLFGGKFGNVLFSTILMVNLFNYGASGEIKDSWINLRFDRFVWKTLAYFILLAVIVSLPVSALGFIHMVFDNLKLTAGLSALVALVLIYFYLRLVPLFVAVAVGDKNPLRSTLCMTKGRVIYIFFTVVTLMTMYIPIFILTGIPFGLATAALSSLYLVHEEIASATLGVVGFLYFLTCSLYILALTAKTLTNIYLECKGEALPVPNAKPAVAQSAEEEVPAKTSAPKKTAKKKT